MVLAFLCQNSRVLPAFVSFDTIWLLGRGAAPNRLKIVQKAGKAGKTHLFLWFFIKKAGKACNIQLFLWVLIKKMEKLVKSIVLARLLQNTFVLPAFVDFDETLFFLLKRIGLSWLNIQSSCLDTVGWNPWAQCQGTRDKSINLPIKQKLNQEDPLTKKLGRLLLLIN